MSSFIEAGEFSLYYGCMKSGKTEDLLKHMSFLEYTKNISYSFFKPSIDTRKERSLPEHLNPIIINTKRPGTILRHITNQQIIAIDEIQFFSKGIIKTIDTLLRENINVVAAGLHQDFRGKPYGSMGTLITMATKPEFVTAVCEYENCNEKAIRTQRLVNGKPASAKSPTNLIEGSNEHIAYEARCLNHHYISK